jgi:glycosyltransferase involved in cell wall biosynthesis
MSVTKIWLPHIRAGSGLDVYTTRLADALTNAGHQTVMTAFPHYLQYMPWWFKSVQAPLGTDIVLANTWNAFAFCQPHARLVVVEHLCIFDPTYIAYRSFPQAVFHEALVRRFEKASLRVADAVVAVSGYTARSIGEAFRGVRAEVIYNAIDTDFFCPRPTPLTADARPRFRLLFVGNLSHRKGVDLLPKIMETLGEGYELHYTQGLRTKDTFKAAANMVPLGRLNQDEVREAYRDADLLLFPSRFEGYGYAVAEAMACGTPVVATACSSLPELVEDGVTGRLCPTDDTTAFAEAIRDLTSHPTKLTEMGRRARAKAEKCFGIQRMLEKYLALFDRLLRN